MTVATGKTTRTVVERVDERVVQELATQRVSDIDARLSRIESLVGEVLEQARTTNGRVNELERALFGDHRPGMHRKGVAEQVRENQPVIDDWSRLNRKMNAVLTAAGAALTAAAGALVVRLVESL